MKAEAILWLDFKLLFPSYLPSILTLYKKEVSSGLLWSSAVFNIFINGLSNKTLEKEMAIYFSILAWKIPWTEEPGRLQSTGSQRISHDWATEHINNKKYDFQI